MPDKQPPKFPDNYLTDPNRVVIELGKGIEGDMERVDMIKAITNPEGRAEQVRKEKASEK